LGFQNDQGGYELRNPSFKASVSPKTITTLLNVGQEVAVFEGFFDLFSFQTMQQKLSLAMTDFF
jgi:hypothetical protein